MENRRKEFIETVFFEVFMKDIIGVHKDSFYPLYNALFEALFYPHKVKDSEYAVYKEFIFTLKDEHLYLLPFLYSTIKTLEV